MRWTRTRMGQRCESPELRWGRGKKLMGSGERRDQDMVQRVPNWQPQEQVG